MAGHEREDSHRIHIQLSYRIQGRYEKIDRDYREITAELLGRNARFPATGIKVGNARRHAWYLHSEASDPPTDSDIIMTNRE